MKTKDIVVGEDYAEGRSDRSSMSRVRVLEVGVERKIGHYNRTAKDGVRVLMLTREGEPQYRSTGELSEIVTPSRRIHWTWQEELDRQVARQTAMEAADQKRAEFNRRRIALKDALGMEFLNGSSATMSITLPIDIAERLVFGSEEE